MLLVDQVELLRQNLVQMPEQQVALPLMGGVSATRHAYQFKFLIHPARDIATTITKADAGGDKLPKHLRGWNLNVTDGFGRAEKIQLKKLLGMVIHVYYLRVGDGDLDLSNDSGERVIVPYSTFLNSVKRLVLSAEDICLVICRLAEQKLKKEDPMRALEVHVPGSGDLQHCLATIKKWPLLQESIWKTFFADHCVTVEADCQTVNNQPFVNGARLVEKTLMWRVGWRRNDAYAKSWINVSHLIRKIQDHFYRPYAKF